MPKQLSELFEPKSIAIVGASRSSKKVGGIVLKNLVDAGYKGEVYPVNPHAKSMHNYKVVSDVSLLPENIDLAVIAIPAKFVNDVLNTLGEKKVKNVVVLSAGFKEIDEEGAKLEQALVEIAKKHSINILGPNCLGFVNNLSNINLTFAQPVHSAGNIRFISQSGAIAASVFDWCDEVSFGFSSFFTLGNKAGITENDLLAYFNEHQDDYSKISRKISGKISNNMPVGMYLESISDGEEFLKITKVLSEKNPIFVIKPGKTEAGAHAMKSHTGSLAGEDKVFEAAVKQAGVLRCNTLEDFFDLAKTFAWENIPQGNKVAIVSNAGGPAVISADAAVEYNLELVKIDKNTKQELEKVLPREASFYNPVDVLGDALAERYGRAAEIIIQNTQVDALIFVLTPQLMTQIKKTAQYIGYLSTKYKKPIFCSFMGGTMVKEGEKILNEEKIPNFRYPERAIFALGQMLKYKKYLDLRSVHNKKPKNIELDQAPSDIRGIIQKAVNEKYKTLDNIAADTILSSIGIKTPPTKYVSSQQEALDFANEHGWPVVLKLSSPGLLHKKRIGGVITDIIDEDRLDDGFHKIQRAIELVDTKVKDSVKIQIQKQILGGIEVIVGVKYDQSFGPILLFGAGGTYVDLINDINIHLLPINLEEAKSIVESSKIYSVLKGSDHQPPYALDKLYELIVRVGKLATVMPEASDFEINPVVVTLNDVWAVDGKVIMKEVTDTIKPVSTGPKLKTARAISCQNLASKFSHYELELDEPLDFQPGQYISVKVAPDAIRAYSIATRHDDKHIALLVDTRPGGPGSMFFENLKPGDVVPFLGPFGVFTFKDDPEVDDLLFLATGSGCSAVRSMIDALLLEQNYSKPMTLYFGLTYPHEIFWQDHFEELEKKYPNFKLKIAIFKPDETWTGATGFITELVKQDYPDASKCAAYLCGHRAMIADATDLLIANGCNKDKVYTERFV